MSFAPIFQNEIILKFFETRIFDMKLSQKLGEIDFGSILLVSFRKSNPLLDTHFTPILSMCILHIDKMGVKWVSFGGQKVSKVVKKITL